MFFALSSIIVLRFKLSKTLGWCLRPWRIKVLPQVVSPVIRSLMIISQPLMTQRPVKKCFQQIRIQFKRFVQAVKTAPQLFQPFAGEPAGWIGSSFFNVDSSFLQPRGTEIAVELRVLWICFHRLIELLNRFIEFLLPKQNLAQSVANLRCGILFRRLEQREFS